VDGEPPAGYVAFVARHLEPLRRDAARVVGDEVDADRLYPDVLADVAARWRWLELMRTRLGRPAAADEYLHDAFVRRSQRWRSDQEPVIDIQVWRTDGDERDLRVASAAGAAGAAEVAPPWRPSRPSLSSAATRLAPFLRPAARGEVGVLAEAAVAWWHAYEASRRRRIVAGVVAGLVVVAAALRAQQAGLPA
jgi:hypothetical protein